MGTKELTSKVRELRELRRMADELSAKATHAELYRQYTKETPARRFCLAG